MSRGTSPNSITYELNNSCDSYKEQFCKQDTISQLKVQVFEKDQNKKNYRNLLSMYNNLQGELAKISELKKRHEIALQQFDTDERNQAIAELKIKNENLFNELNDKIVLNKKLYSENNSLFRELEAKSIQNEDLQEQMNKQEILVKKINHDKEQLKSQIISLSQIKEKQENDIQNLTVQIEQINIDNNSQANFLSSKNGENNILLTSLNDEKSINQGLVNELRTKESNLISSKQQLTRDTDNIKLMKNDINNLGIIIKKNAEDITTFNDNLLKETTVLNQLNSDNQQLDTLVRDRDAHINQISSENNVLKQGNTEINLDNQKLSSILDAYRKHYTLLITQNKKLSGEIQSLIGRDTELRSLLERGNHLRDVKYENDNLVSASTDKVKAVINDINQIPLENEIKISVKRSYSIDNKENGDNGRNIINSNNIISSDNNNSIDVINDMDNREINPSMSGISNQRNNVNISQGLIYMDGK